MMNLLSRRAPWLPALLDLLTRPSAQIRSRAERDRARLQSGLLLIYCGAVVNLEVFIHLGIALVPSTAAAGILASLSSPFLAYLLSRSRWYRLASATLAALPIPIVFVTLLETRDPRLTLAIVPWLSASLLICSLILPLRWTLVIAAWIGSLFPLLALKAPELQPALAASLLYFANIAFLSSLNASLRSQAEKHISRAITRLRKSLRFNRALLSSIPDALLTIDSENRIVRKQGGCLPLALECPRPCLQEALTQLRISRSVQLCRYSTESPQGETRYFEARLAPFEDGQALMMIRDITTETLRERLIESQRLRLISTSKMSALGEMAAGIAHEINSPLLVIEGHARQLEDMLKEGTLRPEAVQNTAAKLLKTSSRIARIIRGLRAFAKEGSDADLESANLRQILDETLAFCEARIRHRGIHLEVRCPPEGVALECRPTEISQVLLNLLNNSYDAVKDLPEKWIRLEAKDQGERVSIAVTDSGRGIPLEVREKIMQPFFTTKGPNNGTGIGLSISKGLIEAHGGRLSLDTASAHTCFVAELPKQDRTARRAAA